ncbi:MAG: XRE family transcriptional regulator, partial [Brevundimonas sp.]|uniref:XRE family transcriptional regulator n=1 Tax=Brevundimonas sp. TaxID=1871086 RepID=UPI002732C397
FTQAGAATAIDVARTTIVAIEQGQRRARLDELQRLATLYGTTLNGLLRREAVQVDLRPRFRRGADRTQHVDQAAEILTSLVRAEVELEDLLGVRRTRSDPPERPLLPGDIVRQAEEDASELRQWLGLGMAPIHDMRSLLELQLGVRVFVRHLEGAIDGLYAFDDAVGPCILINGKFPRARRRQTAAHELGHFVSTRRSPDALYEGSTLATREERYAHAFGRAFLTPARTVMSAFRDVTAGAANLTRRHVILLAQSFGVSMEAMVRRLEELKLTKPGTWDWFVDNGGITSDHIEMVLGQSDLFTGTTKHEQAPSFRLDAMASEAWRRGLLSEGQIASLLQTDRTTARMLIAQYDDEGPTLGDRAAARV